VREVDNDGFSREEREGDCNALQLNFACD